MVGMTKNFFKKIKVKTLVEHFLSSKPVEIYLRWINKQLDKWQKEIQNSGECTIDWNEFFVELSHE